MTGGYQKLFGIKKYLDRIIIKNPQGFLQGGILLPKII
jgi:predicted HTH transcriptional regulator